MDTQQLRQLKPKLRKFLSQFDDCFLRKDTRCHLPTYVEGQLSSLQDKSVEPIALKAGVAPRTTTLTFSGPPRHFFLSF